MLKPRRRTGTGGKVGTLGDLSLSEFIDLADSFDPISPFPPPPVAQAYRVAAGVPVGTVATYCGASYRSLERAERGIFHEPRSISKEKYGKALRACENWLAMHKPGTLGDIFDLWREMLEQANRKAG